jgi:hypothetical protein
MSPEYAMGGRFSEKSDVSGRRNTSFYDDEQAMSLLGFVSLIYLIASFFKTSFACF